MKLLHRAVFLVVFVLLTATGLGLIGLASSEANWQALDAILPGSRLVGGSIGVVLFCLASLLFLTGLQPRRGSGKVLSFSNDNGAVNISTDAIAEYISKLASEFPSIVRMVPHVIPHLRKVDILVEVRIKAGPQLHEICEVLQKRVRESMEKGLGISEVGQVIVRVDKISVEHKTE